MWFIIGFALIVGGWALYNISENGLGMVLGGIAQLAGVSLVVFSLLVLAWRHLP